MRLLYIEDNQLDRLAFQRLANQLSHINYHVAPSLQAGISAIEEEQFDLVLIDYFLGADTAEDLLKQIDHLPAIILSGIDQPIQLRKEKYQNLLGQLHKPLRLDDLKQLTKYRRLVPAEREARPSGSQGGFDYSYLQELKV